MADAATLPRGPDRNIMPPRDGAAKDRKPVDPHDATILAMTGVGIFGTALILGWLTWLSLRLIPYPETLAFDVPAAAAGATFTAANLWLAKITGLWK